MFFVVAANQWFDKAKFYGVYDNISLTTLSTFRLPPSPTYDLFVLSEESFLQRRDAGRLIWDYLNEVSYTEEKELLDRAEVGVSCI